MCNNKKEPTPSIITAANPHPCSPSQLANAQLIEIVRYGINGGFSWRKRKKNIDADAINKDTE